MSDNSPFVMIIEGNFMIADSVRASLAGRGYRVTLIGSARAALTLAQRDPPDLVIVDLSLKDGLLGVEAAKELRALGATVIVCTAFDGAAAEKWIDMLRPCSVLRKPVVPEDMLEAVTNALATRSMGMGHEPLALSP